MRQHYDSQRRFDCTPVGELMLNYDCRDEVIPILAGLQYIYTCSDLRRKLVKLIAEDINEESRRDVGRPCGVSFYLTGKGGVCLGLIDQ